MAEEHAGIRKDYLKELAPWTKLFSAFKIALDPKKLVLAGSGLLVMALGWYVISAIFWSMSGKRPEWKDYADNASGSDVVKRKASWDQFKRDRHQWNLLYEMAGTPTWEEAKGGKKGFVPKETVDDADLSQTPEEFDQRNKGSNVAPPKDPYLPFGRFTVMPWFEDRGQNPYLLVSGSSRGPGATAKVKTSDGGFVNWFIGEQLPVLLEPLYKFYQPILYLFDPAAGFWNRAYLFLIILWSLATWAFFGGAITRIAAVQIARANERVSLKEAAKFVWTRYKSYLTAPIFPLLFLAVLTLVLIVFGLAEGNLGWVGDFVGPLLWPLVLLVGLIMAVVLVGLVGWPMMYTTISAEGSDSFDAISRSYSYVYQAPWHYLWYSLVAIAYGAVLVFFVGLMGSLMVYTSKWAVGLAPTFEDREPTYLYRWAPTSFGWRDLLLHKSPHAEMRVVVNNRGQRVLVTEAKMDTPPYTASFMNNFASFVVSIWLYLLFLLIVGFGYSYFWTASTIIYLLMRQKVDDTEMDEIHVEEEPEQPFAPPSMSPPSPTTGAAEPPKSNLSPLQMVEPPQLRTPPPATSPPANAPGSPQTPSAEPMPPPRPDGPH